MPTHSRAELRQAVAERWGHPPRRLRFAAPLEAEFERETRAGRARHLLRFGLATIALSPLLIAALPEARTGAPACLPAALLGLLLLRRLGRFGSPAARESALLCVAALSLLPAVAALASGRPGPAAWAAALLALVFVDLGLRPRFPAALAFTTLAVAASAASLPHLAAATALPLAITGAGFAGIALYGNHTIEAGERAAYLLGLRARIESEDLARSGDALGHAATDWLTGIASRRGFDARLRRAWQQAAEAAEPLALAIVEPDDWRAPAEADGRDASDTCLVAIAAALQAELRDGLDRLSRHDGGAFSILMPRLDREGATRAAERLRHAVEALRLPDADGAAFVTISLGVAAFRAGQEGSEPELLAAAEAALRSARQRGRNRVHPQLAAYPAELAC